MSVLIALLLTLTGAAGLAVVRTREPVRQAMVAGLLSLLLALLFFVLNAPDVALSELVVGTVAVPLMVLLAIGKLRQQKQDAEHARRQEGGE